MKQTRKEQFEGLKDLYVELYYIYNDPKDHKESVLKAINKWIKDPTRVIVDIDISFLPIFKAAYEDLMSYMCYPTKGECEWWYVRARMISDLTMKLDNIFNKAFLSSKEAQK